MNTKPFHDLHLSTLGMGNMRLPQNIQIPDIMGKIVEMEESL